jgi:hypothetical protein
LSFLSRRPVPGKAALVGSATTGTTGYFRTTLAPGVSRLLSVLFAAIPGYLTSSTGPFRVVAGLGGTA